MKFSELRNLTRNLSREQMENMSSVQRNLYLKKYGLNMENIYQELEMDSLYVNAHEDFSKINDVVQLHSHNFYEILFCRSGNIQYQLGSERYRVRRGDIIVIPAGMSHQPLYLEKLTEPYRRYVLWISQNFIRYLQTICVRPAESISNACLLRTAGTSWEKMEEQFLRCCMEDQQKKPGYELALYGGTMQLMAAMYQAARAIPPVMREKPELADEITLYIENHLGEKITLAQISQHFLVSESKVSHLFLEKLGVSFYQWVIKRRLIAAKNLIQEGKTLEEVGAEVGFGDYTTFYRAFKKEFGIPPSKYREII